MGTPRSKRKSAAAGGPPPGPQHRLAQATSPAAASPPETAGPFLVSAAVLAFVVLAVFSRVLSNQFVSYDDQQYVTENFHVQSGLSWAGIKWAFATTAAANWHPLTWLSHMLDYELYGLKAWGHHLTSVLIHVANTVLLFAVLRKMTRAFWRSWFVAALFGLHPMHVESVAWVAERKDVLSMFFGLLALWAYGLYAQSAKRKAARHYFLSLLFFACGLMSKPMLVTLPFILMLLDFWPLNRLQNKRRWSLVVEKLPFFLLAAASCVMTYAAQESGNAITATTDLPLGCRLENVLVSYASYLGKLFVPVNLAVIYPYQTHWPWETVILSGALLVVLIVAVMIVLRVLPWLTFGWLWFLGTLVPVIGLVQVGSQGMADRYSYLPFIGLFVVVAWGADALTKGWRQREMASPGAAAIALTFCGALSWQQAGCWQNNGTLFRHAAAVTEHNFIALASLGDYELAQGHVEQAIALNREAIQLMPSFAPAYGQLGTALCKAGHAEEGISAIKQALKMDPKLAQTHGDLADALLQIGHYDEAIGEYQEAIGLAPDNLDACNHLGVALENSGRLDEAVIWLEKTVHLYPGYIDAHNNLGLAFEGQGRLDEALHEYQETVRLDPRFSKGHFNLGMILKEKGRLDEAIVELDTGLKLNPNIPQAHNELGLLFGQKGRWSDAIQQFQTALRLKPDFDYAKSNLDLALKQSRVN